jgi:hypothetical protein
VFCLTLLMLMLLARHEHGTQHGFWGEGVV